jgi:EAL domain-containing protein (putative c-di-GMP-specific phosphodiesterase class I)
MRGEMRLEFQPVFSLPTLELVGVEALLGWTSPTFDESPRPSSSRSPRTPGGSGPSELGSWTLYCERVQGTVLGAPESADELTERWQGRQQGTRTGADRRRGSWH